MEVWSSGPQQHEPQEQQEEQPANKEASKAWAPLDSFVKGEVEALGLTSPVYTGISLHYRCVEARPRQQSQTFFQSQLILLCA